MPLRTTRYERHAIQFWIVPVSHQRPIFNGNLYGKANRVVMNDLMGVRDRVRRTETAIEWATTQLQPPLHDMSSFLAMITGWSTVTGNTMRWRYSFKRAVRQLQANVIAIDNADDDLASDYIAINLYEFKNNDTFLGVGRDQDGPLNDPYRTVGPVGADWTGSYWANPDIPQPVIMHKVYIASGDIGYVFSHPNPVRCIEAP